MPLGSSWCGGGRSILFSGPITPAEHLPAPTRSVQYRRCESLQPIIVYALLPAGSGGPPSRGDACARFCQPGLAGAAATRGTCYLLERQKKRGTPAHTLQYAGSLTQKLASSQNTLALGTITTATSQPR